MIKRIFQLFKITRKLATSGAINYIDEPELNLPQDIDNEAI